MRKAFKYRIYLSNGQRRILEQQLELSRWVYNETLAYRKQAYEEEQRTADWYETKRQLPVWTLTRPDLKLVHSQVLQNVTERVDLAFNAFFRRMKAGAAEVGFPRFKGFGRYASITYPQYGNGVRLDGERLLLSKVGAVHIVLLPPTGNVDFGELSRAVGVDVGLSSFATLSDGQKIDNPRFYRRDEADLKRVQQRKDAAKNAQNWPANAKQKGILARIHERIANRRADFAHKRSRELVDTYHVIVFEDLAPLELGKSRGMRKSILDVAWTQFISMTVAKAVEAGRRVILVNPRNTTKMCSSCGELGPKTLSVRVQTCPHSGLVLDRDENAALTILQRGLRSLRQ